MSLKKLFKKQFLTIALVCSTLIFIVAIAKAGTKGKILGKVVDAQTGEPLAGVNVMILDTILGAATDLEGEFLILNVPPGTYRVQATMMGYKPMIQTGVRVNVDRTTNLDFRLDETVIEFEEAIVVTAERPLVERDQTSTRHFVEAQEITARPTSQLTEILTTLPGIDVAEGEFIVRRGSMDQVAFLIDGIRARNPLDHSPYTNINLTAIQELEIITGGFNAEYGEAQSGVFNIVTKEGSDRFEGYGEFRWTPPGKHHWGTAFYDYSTTRYWENTNARHLQWWIDNPDQWMDSEGNYGNDPSCNWTPEQAYQDYIATHQPLTDYTKKSGYQGELALGGPLLFNNLHFFFSGKYNTTPPITGNAYRDMGSWFDGTAKLTYQINPNMRFMLSGIYSIENTCFGMESMQLTDFGIEGKYAYYTYSGFPEYRLNGQTLKFTHVLGVSTFYELHLSRMYQYVRNWTFPGDEDGWEETETVKDHLRAVDEDGNAIRGGNQNVIQYMTGYYYRGIDKNTEFTFSGDITSQLKKRVQLKAGFDFIYYNINRYQEAKAFNTMEDQVYHPFEGNIYAQSKLEFEGLIMNLGLRLDFYNPNDKVYLNPYDPFDIIGSTMENRDPQPDTRPTRLEGQLSPRVGISHPISEKTVLHFSYGHFFQRPNFGNYGEGTGGAAEDQQVNGILNTYQFISDVDTIIGAPYNLGNRELKPRKTVAFELGIEHNFGGIVVDVTPFYKDIRNNVRTVTVVMEDGTSYLTTGNSDYSDAKGIEISLRKPFSGYWGGYLNYSWSTGIAGRSGDPDIIAAPNSGIQTRVTDYVGDVILYDPARLKFGITVSTPEDFHMFGNAFSNIQVALDYQIYYPHKRFPTHNYLVGGGRFIRPPDRNADLRIRKEFQFSGLRLAAFTEIHNLFNDKWVNVQTVYGATAEDQVRFVNSHFSEFPEIMPDGGPFPDVIKYRNLPRRIIFGLAFGF